MIRNPVLTAFNPDPSNCPIEDDYYIAISKFEWFPGMQIHHPKDLKNWHFISHPLNKVSQLNMKGFLDSGRVRAPYLCYS